MAALFQFLGFALPLAGLFVLGVGFWAVGQLLRRKGYGDQLDRIDVRVSNVKRRTGWMASPLSGAVVGVLRGINRVPLLGSKRNRAMWDAFDPKVQQRTKPDSK